MNKILLAGSNGFIGSFLYNSFNKDYNITSIDFNESSIGDNFFLVNLTNMEDVEKICENIQLCDALIFLVGLAHKKGVGKELNEFRSINKKTLINLISFLDKKNRLPSKIIFASTISIYGEKRKQTLYPEWSEKEPFSPYAMTKLEAEEFLMENYRNQSWILRLAPVYASNFHLNINRRTRIGDMFYRVGKGSRKLSLCNIENIGVACKAIINNELPIGVYNLSDSKEYTYNDLLRWQKARWILSIPTFIVKILYYLGRLISNTFLKENTSKLITDNVFPADKIRKYIDLPALLTDIHLSD